MGCRDGYSGMHTTGGHQGGQGGLLGNIAKVALSVEQRVTSKLCDKLPRRVKRALDVPGRNPWRAIILGTSMTAIMYSQFLVMPFTFPLAIAQLPMMLFLFQARFFWDVISECGSVSTAVRKNACDLRDMVKFISPQTASGRTIRKVLELTGQTSELAAVDAWTAKARPVLDAICNGRLPTLRQATSLGVATAEATSDPALIAAARRTESETQVLEEIAIEATATLGVLSPSARGFTSESESVISAQSIGAPTGRSPQQRKKASAKRGKRSKKAGSARAREKARREKAERDAMRPITTEGDLLDDDRESGIFGGKDGGVPWVPIGIAATVLAAVGAVAASKRKRRR